MSATLAPPPVRTATVVPGAPLLPQVNLLPPEIRAGRQFGRVKAWLGVSILITVLLCGLIVLWAAFASSQAQDELTQVQDENAALLAEQSTYAEVPQVLNQLGEAVDARTLGMASEILWRPYLAALAATTPGEVSVDTVSVVTAASAAGAVAPLSPLQAPSIGTLTFSGRSLTVPDTAAWLDQLATVPGFADPYVSSVQVTESEGVVYYQVTGTVQVSDVAYADRFIPVEETS